MAEVVKFLSEKDILCAMEILETADETYSRVPTRLFIVSSRAVKLFRESQISFQVLGSRGENEKQSGQNS